MAGVGQRELLLHAVLVGLTPLIPIPFLDDAVKAAIERRLVRRIAAARGRRLDADEARALTEEPSGNLLVSIGKGIVLFPFKLIFRKLFVVLEVKRASDEASKTYHRGYLFDVVLHNDVLAPNGPHTPAQVREALEKVVDASAVSPLGRSLAGVFEGSRAMLVQLARSLRRERRSSVDHAVEEVATRAEGAFGSVLDRMAAAVAAVPAEHFDGLREHLARELGVPLAEPSRAATE